MGRIMALDMGLKRTGIAVTDPLQMIATGLTTVATDTLEIFLKQYFLKENVDIIVVGLPRNLDHTYSESYPFIQQKVEALKKIFSSVQWVWEDERFTSKIALRSMKTAGASKKEMKSKETLDQVSATIILQSYLEHK
jgi:putative Holliday junction resolvase